MRRLVATVAMMAVMTMLHTGAAAQMGAETNVAVTYDHMLQDSSGSTPLGAALHIDRSTRLDMVTMTGMFGYNQVSESGEYQGISTSASARQMYIGAGPGLRGAATEKLDVIAHLMIGYMRQSAMVSTSQGQGAGRMPHTMDLDFSENKFKARPGVGVEYRMGESSALRFMFEYDTEPHLNVGVAFRY